MDGKSPVERIGVFGSSSCKSKNVSLAFKVGRLIAENDFSLVTGGSTGISEACAEGAVSEGGDVSCILPRRELASSSDTISAIPGVRTFHALEGGYKTRNTQSVSYSDIAVFIEGGWGTLNELTLAVDHGVPCCVFPNSGGICSVVSEIVSSAGGNDPIHYVREASDLLSLIQKMSREE